MQINKIQYAGTIGSSGAALIYTLAADERISSFYDGMFRNNDIKGVLKFTAGSTDKGCMLRFETNERIPLAKLMTKPLKRGYMLTLLSNIGAVMSAAQKFMLEESCFVLEKELIYVDVQTLDVSLLFDPTFNKHEYSYRNFAKNWAVSGGVDLSEDDTYPAKLIRFINSMKPEDDIASLQKFIEELRNEPVAQQAQAASAQTAQPAQQAAPTQPAQQAQQVQQVQPAQPARPTTPAPTASAHKEVTAYAGTDEVSESFIEPPVRALQVYLTDSAGNQVIINKPKFQIGKGKATATPNDHIIQNPSVSRAHALIERTNNDYHIIDLYSLNGTFVNGVRLVANEKRHIKDGDTIVFANEQYTFHID
ncbi:MAG: FHA domain-containing protein [Ruminococcaceae bacterium]|nr:FHA domain-containing protein [Oscillospiraceae bacterium]